MAWETKIRIVALVAAAFLFIGGCKAARHPKLTLVMPKTEVAQVQKKSSIPPTQATSSENYAHFVTSQTSRYFGVFRMIAGGALAIYIALPWWKNRTARGVAPASETESPDLQETEAKPKG